MAPKNDSASLHTATTQSLLQTLAKALDMTEEETMELALHELAQSRQLAIVTPKPTATSALPDPPAAVTDEHSDAVAGSE